MTSQTVVDYIHASLEQDFGLQAPIILTWLENRMEEFDDFWVSITCEEQADFQSKLELLVYPFLACYKALVDADIAEKQARNYCKKIWKKMPVGILQETVNNPLFH